VGGGGAKQSKAGAPLHDKEGAFYAGKPEVTRLGQQLPFARESETRIAQQVTQTNEALAALAALDASIQQERITAEAALDLGAKPLYALRKVILPEIMPGVITGALIAFTMSIDDFVISFFTTGNGVSNLSIAIYSMAKRGVKPEINALSTLMFVTVMVLRAITNLRTLRNGKPVKIRKELQP